MTHESYLHGDRSATIDLLRRERFSALLAKDILAAPSDGGFVFAVMGAYGSGKTTVLDQVRSALAERATVISFEPWMVGSAEQLVGRFFKVFAESMKRSVRREIRDLAERAERYGRLVGPLGKAVGTALDVSTAGMASRVKEIATGALDATRLDVEGERDEIVKALAEADSKWVVFIDDVDRLTSAEIREVIRLVKNVADFPNTTFVLAFDRWNVEHALASSVRDGREYLEKIIQAPHDLPAVSPHVVRNIIFGEVAQGLRRRGLRFRDDDMDRWNRLYEIGIVPYFRTLRLARQWANVAPLRAAAAGPDVSLPDVLAMEALRVFEPDLFARLDLPGVVAEYTSLVDSISESRAEARRKMIDEAMEHAARPEVARDLLIALIPQMSLYFTGEAANRDDREDRRLGRLASEQAYWAYATANERDKGVVPALLEVLGDEAKLKQRFDDIPPEAMSRVIDELRDYLGDVTPAVVPTFVRALCGQLDPTANTRSHFWGTPLGADIMSLVGALVRKLGDQEQHDLAVELSTTGSPLARYWTTKTFGDHGKDLPPGETAPQLDAKETAQFKQQLADDIAAMTIDEVVGHPQRLLFLQLMASGGHVARVVEIFNNDNALPVVFSALLTRWFAENDQGEQVLAEQEFNWSGLVNLVGDETQAASVVDAMEARRDVLKEDQLEALEQAKHHRGARTVLPSQGF